MYFKVLVAQDLSHLKTVIGTMIASFVVSVIRHWLAKDLSLIQSKLFVQIVLKQS